MLRLQALGTAAARDEAESPALVNAARNAMQGPNGADITLILSQEKLDAPKGAWGLSPNTRTVWTALATLAKQLVLAWGEKWRKLCPAHITAIPLVEAVLRGKVTVASLVPARLAAPTTAAARLEQRDAVMTAWPVLMAMVREITPRDATAESQLLEMAARAFNPARSAGDPITRLVAPVFTEMNAKYSRYLMGGGFEPTWAYVAELTEKETMLNYSLDMQVLPKPAATPGQQLTTEQQEAKAVVNREAAAACAVQRREGVKQAGKDGPEYVQQEVWASLSPAEKKAKTKARADAEENTSGK